jgi:hypothetical protein
VIRGFRGGGFGMILTGREIRTFPFLIASLPFVFSYFLVPSFSVICIGQLAVRVVNDFPVHDDLLIFNSELFIVLLFVVP